MAVIPARGGSKRIPRKNIREMSGDPLISWPIRAALESGTFDLVIVSTDDEEIAEIAVAAGATVPFVRPAELADDWTPTLPVVAHAIRELKSAGLEFELTCCLYPATLFVSGVDMCRTRDLLLGSQTADYVVTVTKYPMPIELALNVDDDFVLKLNTPQHYGTRTQDLPTRYHDVGQLYWGRSESWLRDEPLLDNCLGYPLPSWRAQDIDTDDDWDRAQILHSIWLQQLASSGGAA